MLHCCNVCFHSEYGDHHTSILLLDFIRQSGVILASPYIKINLCSFNNLFLLWPSHTLGRYVCGLFFHHTVYLFVEGYLSRSECTEIVTLSRWVNWVNWRIYTGKLPQVIIFILYVYMCMYINMRIIVFIYSIYYTQGQNQLHLIKRLSLNT